MSFFLILIICILELLSPKLSFLRMIKINAQGLVTTSEEGSNKIIGKSITYYLIDNLFSMLSC